VVSSRKLYPASCLFAFAISLVLLLNLSQDTRGASYNAYIANLHSHTGYSDGSSTPAYAYQWAKGSGVGDFLAVTDHTHWSWMSEEKFTDTQVQADAYTDASFVGIAGFEFTTRDGDINVFKAGWSTDGATVTTPADYYDYLVANWPDSIAQWNHPSDYNGGITDYSTYTPSRDSVMELIEVVNRNTRYESSYIAALDAGWHIAPTAGQDNHSDDWLTGYEIRSVILAPSLTRDDIYAALRAHRVYATENRNLEISYDINGNIMGSTIYATECNVYIQVSDPATAANTDRIAKIELVRNGGVVAASQNFASHSVEWSPTISPCNAPYYFVRVTNAANKKAWTAPVWIDTNPYSLTTSVSGSGSVAKSPDQSSYHYGDVVTLTATPAPGWEFTGWGGHLGGSTNPVTLTMGGDKSITAAFYHIPRTLAVGVTGSGSVARTPDQATYFDGDVITLTATPEPGWGFTGWDGDLGGSTNPITLTMGGDKSVTAAFYHIPRTLAVNVFGGGSVTRTPDQETYLDGDVITLTAIPAAGWGFTGWGGDLDGSTNPITITMNGNRAVTATFSLACTPVTAVDFTFTPNPVLIGQPVNFTALLAGATRSVSYTQPVSYTWNIASGPDIMSTTGSLLHTFPPASTFRTYPVKLTVTNACSQLSVQKDVLVQPFLVYFPIVRR